MRRFDKDRSLTMAAVTLTAMVLPRLAEAKTFRCADGDVQCLIFSIDQANTNGQPRNTIRLDGTTYTLTAVDNDTDGPNGFPSITSDLTIVSPQETATITLAANAPALRFFHVGAGGHLTLKGVTVSNARSVVIDGSVLNGHVLYSRGELTIVRSTFSANNTFTGVFNDRGELTITDGAFTNNNGAGFITNSGGVATISRTTFQNSGGVFSGVLSNTSGQMTISECVFDSNSAVFNGVLTSDSGTVRITKSRFVNNRAQEGVVNLDLGTVTIENTTFEGNQEAAIGNLSGTLVITNSAFVGNLGAFAGTAGIFNGATGWAQVTNTTFARNRAFTVFNRGQLILANTTFAENESFAIASASASTIRSSASDSATTILENTIVVHSPDQVLQDCDGPITSLGNNIIGDPTGCTVALQPGDRTGGAGLGAFTDDGVPGHGHFPLLPDSQAIDNANDSVCPLKDQIGNKRRRRNCDIGAIEFVPPAILP